ncbi:MAG TPA: HAMP domain-containing sensor histidine kinase [Chloroflexota bacterium]|jgi:signal transduction histidine kinase|nr:HAMP domain-containing sensor histidine kinase [Chloroflexota bacterium]
MRRALSRLRWQLTLSHLVAIAFTLLSMIAAVIVIATSFIANQASPSREAAQDARLVAESVSGLVSRGDTAQLNGVLRVLADGSLRVVAPFGPPPDRRPFTTPGLRDVAYIVVLGLDGQPLAASDPSGAGFAPSDRDQWPRLAAQVLSARGFDELQVARGTAQGSLGAAPIIDDAGRRVGVALVATTAPVEPARGLGFLGALAIFGAASVAVLTAASLFALISASVVAYVLSRRLVARLEHLGVAVEAFAAGDLDARAPVRGADEVGQLGDRFNRMAADLSATLRELKAERDRVSGLLSARQQLVAGVSHELRTPVATIRGYLDSALRHNGAAARGDLETIERELVRLERLINDLFTLSAAEVGRLTLRAEPTDVGSVVRRLVDTHAPLAWSQRKVQVLAEAPDGLPPARADAERLDQVISNLLGNAIRHTPPGGLVAACVRGEPDAVCLEVRDTGEGIPSDELPHVFDRFYRGRGEEGQPGLGLGLALVKELAEAMGGTASAASTPGEGSSFRVCLPRA